jgi:PncC family amidohydrolase
MYYLLEAGLVRLPGILRCKTTQYFVGMQLFNKKELEKTGLLLLKKKETIAVAESVTSGLMQYAFSTIPNAAQFFQGGITTYNIAQKFKHLQVEPLHALSVNCVSQQVANEMALQVCSLFKSDWGIGITGYSSPVPESENKVFAFFAISYKGKVMRSGKIDPVKKDPTDLQLLYAETVLHRLYLCLK